MEMVMKFPNGETPNLFIEVFNYTAGSALHRYVTPLDVEDGDTDTPSCRTSRVLQRGTHLGLVLSVISN